ncbi:MAG TPA: hypothetical protein VKZ77_16540 [Bacillaceae bacterium]|nr:hypothetical protein [Paenibacillus bovis]HLU24072.1 hypothetical protein [Bacillaceae bacterium]
MKKIGSYFIIVLLLFLAGCGVKITLNDKSSDVDKNTGNKVEEMTDQEDTSEDTTDESDEEKSSSSDEVSEEDTALNELKKAFAEYVNAIKQLAPEEGRLISLYSSVTGENYVNDETLYTTLKKEVVPGYNQFVDDVEEILPRNKEIRAAHEQYIEAVNTQYSAFTLILSAIDAQDPDIITEANGKLSIAKTIMDEYLNTIEQLSEKTGIPLDPNNTDPSQL